jgi:hypothetical protein
MKRIRSPYLRLKRRIAQREPLNADHPAVEASSTAAD